MTAPDLEPLPGYVDELGRPSIPQDGLIPEPDPDSLFPFLERPTPVPAAPAGEKLSDGRRLTLRQRADVERGRHPLTGGRLTDVEGATCGTCRFREPGSGRNRDYPKCLWRPGDTGPYPRITHGPATDCRAWWPGCTDWQAKP